MLVPGCRRGAGLHSQVFDDTLAEPDQRRHGNDYGHEVLAPAATVRATSCAPTALHEHAQGDEQVRNDLGVRCQHIGQQDVPKLPIVRLCDTANADALQGREEAASAGVTEAAPGDDKDQDNEDEECNGEEVIVYHQGG